jgi:AcrR family transcriptional regulator
MLFSARLVRAARSWAYMVMRMAILANVGGRLDCMAEVRNKRAKSIKITKDRKASPGRPRDQLLDEAIMRAALDLFSEYGIEGASIGQIANRAGVARTTIYRRWSSREDLLVNAIERTRNFPEQLMEGLEKMQPEESVNLILEAGVDALTRTQFRKLAARLIGSFPSHPALMSAYQNKYLQPRRLAVIRVFEKARVQGVLPQNTDVEKLCDMLSGAMIYRLFFQPEERNGEKVRTYFLKLFQQAGFRIPKNEQKQNKKPSRDIP